jgi:hypothetical protein
VRLRAVDDGAAPIDGDLRWLLRYAADPDPAIRRPAVELLRALGGDGLDYAERVERRNHVLAETRLPPAVLSRQMAAYRARVWPRTRVLSQCPHDCGTSAWYFWHALALVDRAVSGRQLRRIIRKSSLEMSGEAPSR